MKIIYEPKDLNREDEHGLIGGVFRRVQDDQFGKPVFRDAWLIASNGDPNRDGKRYLFVALHDGFTNGPYTAEEMCERLNSQNHQRMTKPVNLGKEMDERRS